MRILLFVSADEPGPRSILYDWRDGKTASGIVDEESGPCVIVRQQNKFPCHFGIVAGLGYSVEATRNYCLFGCWVLVHGSCDLARPKGSGGDRQCSGVSACVGLAGGPRHRGA